MRMRSAALVAVLVIAGTAGASAQSPDPSALPGLDPVLLEEVCRTNAVDDQELATCLDVVHSILVPGSGPSASEGPDGAQGGTAKVGQTLSRPDADVTVVKVDWSPKSTLKPDAGNRYVAALVRIVATESGASYNPFFWSAYDADGFEYNASAFGADPPLGSSNELPAGKKVQGWVTFEVPRATKTLEIVEAIPLGAELRWVATR